ncbi:NAD(P)/FAD-dependent oxidoreductase [Aliiruegeria lutimaris]|uniref:Pyridine nucleotide-disulphide oxidoreductase n=1 Tax=Aliiruegeria lutimaris TaxID=571298 RepID=A0A1G8VIH5_9RHOB|nr:FAD-dependent oxidoreductase [Aliiruegeria lutimaris]SDJ65848.1 Pyridine nucleotide-disulphide oxidoreductase [Aliiruegeria lutimaris]
MKHLILGNGPAGVVAAETIRKTDPTCSITLVGAEPEPPYSRMAIPYLLEENIDESGTYLRKTEGHFEKLGIELKVGRATGVDPSTKTVQFEDGSTETYDKLLIATGARPILPPIPGGDLPNVHTCWTLDDARHIAALTQKQGAHVVQLGAGFIGCIIMEALSLRGTDLTVVELGDRMVPRMMTTEAGGMIKDWVQKKGINVVTSTKIERIDLTEADTPEPTEEKSFLKSVIEKLTGHEDTPEPAAASVDADEDELTVTLSSGEKIACHAVIISAGVRPNVEFLEGTSIDITDGIHTDDRMETSVPDIFAAGDVVAAPDLFTGKPFFSAIQPNAVDEARAAALNMAGRDARMHGVLPINVLDTLGLISGSFGQSEGVEGGESVELSDPERHRYISLQFDGDVLIGATSIGLTQHVGVIRGLIQGRVALGKWKDVLMKEPLRLSEAYLACAQQPGALAG